MSEPVSDLGAMLAGMSPVLDAASYRFFVPGPPQEFAALHERIFASIYEDEGVTCIVRAKPGEDGQPFARITLMVHSALEGVGLTAAVSSALAEAGLACNMVAGYHHDHLFVPWERREAALAVLEQLSLDART
ncbi:MAG: ACT domain-containing protein [Pseudomonadota bacterium]